MRLFLPTPIISKKLYLLLRVYYLFTCTKVIYSVRIMTKSIFTFIAGLNEMKRKFGDYLIAINDTEEIRAKDRYSR